MQYVSFRYLALIDSEMISQLLLNNPPEYTKYFHPFNFEASAIRIVLQKAVKDRFFGVELKSDILPQSDLIGFYMLRGLDEGYKEPMYGVFISSQYSGKGIARLTISHAETFCNFYNYKKILLKVSLENIRAKKLYDDLGFKFLRAEESSGQIILYKDIK
jgi:ribosomal protein S18 acetylase RimI-like enzyme